MLGEEASQEIEALSAIFDADFYRDPSIASSFVICVAPEADNTSEIVGWLALCVRLPPDYPQSTSPEFTVSGLSQHAHCFPHRNMHSPFEPSSSQVAELNAAIVTTVAELKGEAVVFEVVTAVREWLAANTLTAKPAVDVSDDAALARALDAAEMSEDDLSLDSEDVDEEMIEALREVIDDDDKKLLKLLKKAEQAPTDTKQQRDAIRAVWMALSPAQRREMVEDSEEDGSESEDDEDHEVKGQPNKSNKQAPALPAGSGGVGVKKLFMPPPPQRSCVRGHSLTPVNSKPNDYRKLEGNTGNCDICSKDFKYTTGGYHCGMCRNWDCCLACGSTAAPSGSSNSKAAGQRIKRGKNKT